MLLFGVIIYLSDPTPEKFTLRLNSIKPVLYLPTTLLLQMLYFYLIKYEKCKYTATAPSFFKQTDVNDNVGHETEQTAIQWNTFHAFHREMIKFRGEKGCFV